MLTIISTRNKTTNPCKDFKVPHVYEHDVTGEVVLATELKPNGRVTGIVLYDGFKIQTGTRVNAIGNFGIVHLKPFDEPVTFKNSVEVKYKTVET